MNKFKALVITEIDGEFKREIIERDLESLPEGEILIKVNYSSLNYKDGLSAYGNKGVTRNYPHTPGIDASGVVEDSSSDKFKKGDHVLVTGFDLGMNTSGGFAEYIRVPASWVVKLPEHLSMYESMLYGTAGFTAAISVHKLIRDIQPEQGDILVTGGTGGVATIATKILIKLGYSVVVATRKIDTEKDHLLALGVKEVIDANEVNDSSNKPLLRPRFIGVIDTVGGNVLATAIKLTHYNGVVTACGNAAGISFTSSVFPFILKGITLYGVDSVLCDMPLRELLWVQLANEWKPSNLDLMTKTVTLENLNDEIDSIMNGTHVGRTILKLV